jgi:hypothetical protein
MEPDCKSGIDNDYGTVARKKNVDPTSQPRLIRCAAQAPAHTPGGIHSSAQRTTLPRKIPATFYKGISLRDIMDWERHYKWSAHERWTEALHEEAFRKLLSAGDYAAIASKAVAIESRTNLLFSFEKMAMRDALKPVAGAAPSPKASLISSMAAAMRRRGLTHGVKWWARCRGGRRGS